MESKSQDSIQVCIRIRPDREEDNIVNFTDTEISLDKNRFCFDKIFPPTASQDDVFDAVGHKVIAHTLDGYNGCIFVYGQTGSGKTYTMMGDQGGLMQKSFVTIFSQIQSMNESQCLMTCSYYEIYNQQIIDLLETKRDKKLNIRQDPKKGIFVENLTQENVYSSHKLLECLEMGMKNRHVGQTQMNRESSRSHSIFTISLSIQTFINGIKVLKSPKLHFVDLAGSERQKMTAASGDRLKQASNINRSLTTLGMVINALTSQKTKSHIPYRDSKLTSLLRDSLGGNSKTFLIATIARSTICFPETLSTLNFANRAKMVKVKASINEQSVSNNIQVYKEQIKKLKAEIARLKTTNHQKMIIPVKKANEYNYDEQFKQINNKISSISDNIVKQSISPALEQILLTLKNQNMTTKSQMQDQNQDQQENEGQQALLSYLSNNNKILEKIQQKIEQYNNLKEELYEKVYSEQMYIRELKTPSKFERDQYQEMIARKNKEIDETYEELRKLRNQLGMRDIRIKQLEMIEINKSDSLEERNETIAQNQKQNIGLQRQIISLKNLLAQTNSQMQMIHHRLRQSQNEAKENKQLYLYAEQNYQTEKQLRQQIQNNLYDKLSQIEQMQQRYDNQLQEKKEYYQELQQTLRGQINVLEDTIEFNQKKIAEYHAEIKQLKNQNQILENNVQQMNQIVNGQMQKIEQFEKMTVQLQSQKNYLSVNLMNAQISKQMLQGQNNLLTAAIRKSEIVEMLKYADLEENSQETQKILAQIQEESENTIDILNKSIEQYKMHLQQQQEVSQTMIRQKYETAVKTDQQITELKQSYQLQLRLIHQNYSAKINDLISSLQMLKKTITDLNASITILQQQNSVKQLQVKQFLKRCQQAQKQKEAAVEKIEYERKEMAEEKTKLSIEKQQLQKMYKNVIRENYKLKNRYSSQGKEGTENLVAKLEFYEEKFRLMTIDYNQAQQVVKKIKSKQLTLLEKIAYLEQKLQLTNSANEHDQTAELITENKQLKKELEKYSKHTIQQNAKEQALSTYSKKMQSTSSERQKNLQEKQNSFRQKLISSINKFNASKENAQEMNNRSLDDLVIVWEQLEEQNMKQFDAVSRGIKKQQKLKLQNSCIVKQNLYLKETIAALEKQVGVLGNRPRKQLKTETQQSC